MSLDMLEMTAGNTELDRLRGMTLQSSAPVGLACLDRDFRFVRVNDALAETNRLPVDDHRPMYAV